MRARERESERAVIPLLNIAGRRTEFATFFTTFILAAGRRAGILCACAVCRAIMEHARCVFASPVGKLRITATGEGVCSVAWLKRGEQLEGESTGGKCELARRHLATCTDWLTAYFSGSLLHSPVPRPPLVIPKQGLS